MTTEIHRRVLTRTEMRWARAAFGAMFPAGASERIPLGICDMDLEGYLTDLRSRISFRAAFAIRATIWLIALAPVFFLAKPHTIASIDAASREKVLALMLGSPSYLVRQLVVLLKTVGSVLYAGHPAVRAGILMGVPVPQESGTQLLQLGRKRGAAEEDTSQEAHDEQSVA